MSHSIDCTLIHYLCVTHAHTSEVVLFEAIEWDLILNKRKKIDIVVSVGKLVITNG